MKLIRYFFLMIPVLMMVTLPASAQEEGCTITNVPLPEGSTAKPITLTFMELDALLVLPDSLIVLDCESMADELELVNVSPTLPLNTAPERPTNPEGLAETQDGYAIVNTSVANVRTGPGPRYSQIAVVDGGTRLVVLGHNVGETWWYVQAEDIRGWVWSDLLILRGDLTDVPIVETTGEITIPRVYVGYTGNPLYSELTPDGVVLCNLIGGLEHPVIGRSQNGSWYLIEGICIDGETTQIGWLSADAAILRNSGQVPIPVFNDAEANALREAVEIVETTE